MAISERDGWSEGYLAEARRCNDRILLRMVNMFADALVGAKRQGRWLAPFRRPLAAHCYELAMRHDRHPGEVEAAAIGAAELRARRSR